MKTEEFIKRAKQLADNVITMWTEITYAINTVNGNCYVPIDKSYELEELYRLCFEYAATPINER